MSETNDPGSNGAGGFDDPTAPSWAGPEGTAPPLPSPEPPMTPPSPHAAEQPTPAADPAGPAAVAPGQVPYGQAPYPQTAYGQQPYAQDPYAQQPYAQNPYGQPPYAALPVPYAPAPRSNTSLIILTVVSALALVSCCNVLAVISLVMGIMGLSRNTADPDGAARLGRNGWIAFGVTTAVVVIGWVVFIAFGAAGAFDDGSYDYEGY